MFDTQENKHIKLSDKIPHYIYHHFCNIGKVTRQKKIRILA